MVWILRYPDWRSTNLQLWSWAWLFCRRPLSKRISLVTGYSSLSDWRRCKWRPGNQESCSKTASIYEIVKSWLRVVDKSLNKDGKGQNIWDTWVHQRYPEDPTKAWFGLTLHKNSWNLLWFITYETVKKCNIENCDTADIACDSYHHLDRDIQNILSMGIKNYRFSISWSRLLPTGTRSGRDMSTDGSGPKNNSSW